MQKSFISKMLLVMVLCLACVASTFGQKKFSPTSYISEHKNVAQQLMRETGVPASVILAVAIHESAYGNSRIARYLNNHFGIQGKNNSKKIRDHSKDYASGMDSNTDPVQRRKRPKKTDLPFHTQAHKTPKPWVEGIARSYYSQTKTWKNHVLGTIRRCKLDQYA